jgi:hypothetical protein
MAKPKLIKSNDKIIQFIIVTITKVCVFLILIA